MWKKFSEVGRASPREGKLYVIFLYRELERSMEKTRTHQRCSNGIRSFG